MARRADCHPERAHYARGMCTQCYQAAHQRGELETSAKRGGWDTRRERAQAEE